MSIKLIEAVKKGNLQEIEDCLISGDDIHNNHDHALCWSVENNHLDIVTFLIEKGANIHARHDYPLRCAALYGQYDTVKFFLDNGAYKSAYNFEALKWAKKNKHKEVVDLLENYIPKKQNIQVKNKDLKKLNNDGREFCARCNKLLSIRMLLTSSYKFCKECEE